MFRTIIVILSEATRCLRPGCFGGKNLPSDLRVSSFALSTRDGNRS